MKNLPLIFCKIILIANIVFWTVMAIYFSFFKFSSNEYYLILKVLLFFEPLFFAIALIGLIKEIKIIYVLSTIFVFLNAILSITDEVGIYDIISLILNILALVSLSLVWKQIIKKKITSPNSV
jgi:hypothetical protein